MARASQTSSRFLIGTLFALIVPLLLVPANLYLSGWLGSIANIALTAAILALISAITGVFVLFSRWWVRLMFGAIYVPVLFSILWAFQLSLGCNLHGPSACP